MKNDPRKKPVHHLTLDRLSKKIGDREVLHEISFSVHPGEVFGIVGPDGAGKSSLLKIIAGVWEPDEGTLSLNAKTFSRLPEELRQAIGYMAFDEGLHEELTAGENLEYSASLYDMNRTESSQRIEWLLKKTDLFKFRKIPVKKYSGGMKQKLSLCCALLHRPNILLLDEPSTGIDPLSRRNFWKLLFDLPDEDVTVILTTPYFEEISRCQKVALLSHGRIILSGEPKNLYENSGWKAFDLWPDPLISAVELLDQQASVPYYRVRGHSIHILFPRENSPEDKVIKSLESSGIQLKNFDHSRVELEDLFYLHLKSMSEELHDEKGFRERWASPDHLVHGGRDTLIEAERLKKSFGEVEAVKGATFSVRPGEILGIIGSNGAGKTTLLRMLCGLLKPDDGKVSLFGKDPLGERGEIQNEISYMSQIFALYRDLTVKENIRFYGRIYSPSEEELRERTEAILKITGLEKEANKKVRDLSTGWRQRLALGCTLVHDPSLIFLDEPTSGVDPVTRRYLWHWITYLAEQGKTIIVTTHYMTEAEQCHKIMLMHEGSILAFGTPEQICEAESKHGALFEVECEPVRPAIDVLQKISWIHSVIPYGNQLHIMTPKERSPLRDLPQLLGKEGIRLQYISPIPYSIEDVFLEEIGTNPL